MCAGESVLAWKTDAVVIDVLVNASTHTVENKLLQFAKADSSYRFLLYAGHVITETGNWLLQDGTLSFHSFVKALSAGSSGTGPIDVVTHLAGDWNAGGFAKNIKHVRLNPEKSGSSGGDAIVTGFTKFGSVLASYIAVETVQQLLQGTDVIGVVPFSRPTVNVFQGGNGMSALFGVRGFSMLVDTGFPRRTCCWDFIRHMDHIDVVVLPQVGESNVLGAKSFLERLALGDVRTAIGQVFINAGQASAGKPAGNESAAGDSATDSSGSLLLSLNEVGTSIVECLAKSQILRAPCVTKIQPEAINLYHKIGFGSLDMYVLNPIADSKDLKDFLAGWGKMAKARSSKLNDLVSISTVVAFRPETRGDRPVRILFPGSSPVVKLYEGLDRLKTNPLFQTADGIARPVAHKPATARPGTGSGKPGTVRPVSSSSSVRDAHSSKTSTKTGGKAATESRTSAAESRKATSESTAAKTQDRKTPRDTKSDAKSDGANEKDTKAHPSTSTPKKDAQKTKPNSDVHAAKGNAVPPADKAQVKTMPSPIAEKTASSSKSDEKSAEAKAEISAVVESSVKPHDVSASDSNVDVIPELVPCATEQDTPLPSEVESQVAGEQGDSLVTASAATAAVSDSETAKTQIDGDEITAAAEPSAASESAADQALHAGAEFDPLQSWDAPQSLPAPSHDKAVGSMPPSNSGSDRRGAAGKSMPKDQASSTAGKRTDRPPASARSAGSASGSAKKGALSKATTPFYVDLAYVPTYAVDGCDAEFFRHVRARYYIIPGSSADPHLLSALADAKSGWEGDVTVIPTGNTDALIAWIMAHRDELASLKIEVTPSVARSTLHLERGSTCSAHRLEF